MDSSVIITSIGIGTALFAGMIVIWFFHAAVKRRLGADQSAQMLNSGQVAGGKDFRQHLRHELSWLAVIEMGQASTSVRIKNISLGGAFVICDEPIPLNQKLRIYIDAPDQDTFALNAEVIWSNVNVPVEKVIHRGMGIKFVQNTAAARNRLEEAIACHCMQTDINSV